MKILRFCLIILVCSVSYWQAMAETSSQFLEEIVQTTSKTHTMSCDFVQTKNLAMLNDKLVSNGTMKFSNPDKLRWEYTSPYQYLFIFNGSKVYVKNRSQASTIDVNNNKIFREVTRIMMNTVTGRAVSLKSDFDIATSIEKNEYKIILTPVRKEMKQMFKTVTLYLNKSTKYIQHIQIVEKNGDTTDIQFTNIKVNQPINESQFTIPN